MLPPIFFHPDHTAASKTRRKTGLRLIWLGLMLVASSPGAAANDEWMPATPAELAGRTSSLEADAPAEALLWKIDVDESAFPKSRTTSEYWRYKIFDPEKAEPILHLSQPEISFDGEEFQEVEMSARLTLPNGQTKEFGNESIHERDLVKSATASGPFLQRLLGDEIGEVKEKFLAVSGVEPGSILEFRLRVEQKFPPLAVFRPFQMEFIPVRRLEYTQLLPSFGNIMPSLYLLNRVNGDLSKTEKQVTLTATDLPSLRQEPLAGALSYYAMTLVSAYTQTRYSSAKEDGRSFHFSKQDLQQHPWAPIATFASWSVEDHAVETRQVKKLAAELTQGAGSDLEKAQRIHHYVQQLHQRFLHLRQRRYPGQVIEFGFREVTPDDVINFEKKDPKLLANIDFFWLAVSLYRAAGLPTDVLLLPSLKTARFDERLVSLAFLQDHCAALRIGDRWYFSLPDARMPYAFGALPWELEGQEGLLAREDKQDFIDVPLASPEQSTVTHTGAFTLAEDGTLSGTFQLSLTGHSAETFRALFPVNRKLEGKMAITKRNVTRDFADGANIEITGLANDDDPDKPLEISGTLQWPGFATATGNRLVMRPFVFRTNSPSPFSAAARRNPVYFPFKEKEVDQLTIALPAGYDIEAKFAPPSHPGDVLSHEVKLGYAPKQNILHVERDFSSALIEVDTANYAALKQWYDSVADSDQYQMVLVKNKKMPAAQATAASTP